MTGPTYQLIDSGDFQKLEQIGPFRIIRPSPQAVWRKQKPNQWNDRIDAVFTRRSSGDGDWNFINQKFRENSLIEVAGIKFQIKPTDFGHLGIFAEQEKNWHGLRALVSQANLPEFRVLNLFAYTGGSTLACAQAGAQVVHLDASKTSVAWARENADLNNLSTHPIRWITDDVKKFVTREVKRGSKYHGVILDPPSFGRGTKNEVWKIEEDLPPLLSNLQQLFDEDFRFILLSAHSPGYSPVALKNLLGPLTTGLEGDFKSEEMTISGGSSDTNDLPSGAYCLYTRNPN